jgi:hypothetical protein
VIVVLADGRKVSSTIQAITEFMFKPVQSPAPKVGADGIRPSVKIASTPSKKVVKK